MSPAFTLRLRLGLLAAVAALAQSAVAGEVRVPVAARANFAGRTASVDARRLADWIVASGDSHGLPFVILDKANARVFAFNAKGIARGSAPALIGMAKGDVSPPGIGELALADITPAMRITPAGRFEAKLGRDLGPKDVLWVDYDAAVSLHRVFTGNAAEHRLQRLATATILDNRISYGCINVPVSFYEGVVQPLFKPANGVVYILPEVTPLQKVFAMRAPGGPAAP